MEWFKFFLPCWRHGMARMAIRVSGQHQKHGASLADKIAKWLLRFSGNLLGHPPRQCAPRRNSSLRHYTLPFCEIRPPFSFPDCINISQASWSEDQPSATLTQAFAVVCLSNRPPRTWLRKCQHVSDMSPRQPNVVICPNAPVPATQF